MQYRRVSDYNYSPKHLLLITIMFYGFQTRSAQLSVQQHQLSNITSQCILELIQKYFHESKKIAVWCDHDQRQQNVLEQLFKYTNNPIMINANEQPKGMNIDERTPSDATIILNEFLNITEYLESNLYTEDTIFFTVVWNQSEEMGRMFAEFWNYNVIDTFILHVQDDEIFVYEYVPYVNCKVSEPLLLDKWSGGGFRYDRMNRIEEKVPVTSMNRCHFNVTVVDVPPTIIFPSEESRHGSRVLDGVEGRILATIAEKLNCNFLYKTPDDNQRWGFITPEPGGAVGDVYYRKSIIACGLHTPNVERFTYLDPVVTSSGVTECIAWLVPIGVAKRTPVWVTIYVTEFAPITWLCFISALLFVSACFSTFASVLDNPVNLLNSILYLFPSSMGVTVKKPRTKTLKTIYAAWIWYGLLTTTAYESAVKSKLTVPLRYKDVNTFHELLEADLELYGISNTIRIVLAGNEDPDMIRLGEVVKQTNKSINEIVRKILEDRRTGYLREYTTFFYNAYKNRDAIGQIHRVQQCAYKYYPTMYLQKRSPVTPVVRRVVSGLLESGILLWWRSLFIKESFGSHSKLIKLSIKHMATPFFAYICGMSLSTIVFAAEHVKYNYINQKNRQPCSRGDSQNSPKTTIASMEES